MTSSTISQEVHDEMLDITEPHLYDESIREMNFYEYYPKLGTKFNGEGNPISIMIEEQNIYYVPSKSYLKIKGQIRRVDTDAVYPADAEITLINNAIMYLFSDIRYQLNSTTIGNINNPGQTTSMIGYLSYPDDFSTSSSLKMCWTKDTTNNASSKKYATSVGDPAAGYTPAETTTYNQGFAARKGLLFSSDPRGCFEFHIPLTHIFGFAEYKKIIFGLKHTLTLTRTTDTQALYRAEGVIDGKVDITDITWNMLQIQMSPEYITSMMSLINEKVTLPLAYRSRTTESIVLDQVLRHPWPLSLPGGAEKPRWLIIGFQTARINTQRQNPAAFDNIDLKSASVTLGSQTIPMTKIMTNFSRNEYTTLYDMFDNFKSDYYGIDSLVGGTQVNYVAYKTLFPIIVFDLRKQDERLKKGILNVRVNFEFGTVVPADTTAYSVIISDRFYKLQSDGNKLTVIDN
jgi:hypothetical protein